MEVEVVVCAQSIEEKKFWLEKFQQAGYVILYINLFPIDDHTIQLADLDIGRGGGGVVWESELFIFLLAQVSISSLSTSP